MFLRDLDISDITNETDGIKIRDGYLSDFRGEGKDILYSIVKMNYPLAVRNTRRDFGYSENPASGSDEEMNRYKPPLKTPVGLLPPFCVISKMIHEIKPIDELPLDYNSITQRFRITMDALVCLRTFPGSSNAAWSFLETTASLESSTLYL